MTYHISTPISEFTCTYIFPSGGHIKAIEWRRVKALYNFLLRQGRSLMYYMYPFFLLTSGKGILQPLAASNTCIVKGGFSMHFDLYSNMPFPSSPWHKSCKGSVAVHSTYSDTCHTTCNVPLRGTTLHETHAENTSWSKHLFLNHWQNTVLS